MKIEIIHMVCNYLFEAKLSCYHVLCRYVRVVDIAAQSYVISRAANYWKSVLR